MKPALFPAALFLAACGSGDDDASGGATTNQIERLSNPGEEEAADPQASVRLQPITPVDLAGEGLSGVGCNFSRNGRMLLAAVGSDAIVRVEGDIQHLIHSAPVGPTGGFFEDRQLSVSVGRADDTHRTPDATGSWPARITVTNRRTEVELKLQGGWSCG